MDQKECIILIGLPYSGKTQFYRDRYSFLTRFAPEKYDTKYQARMQLEACLKNANSFVVDSTNHTRRERKHYIVAAKANGFRIIGYYFQSDVDECIKRCNARRFSDFGLLKVLDAISYYTDKLNYFTDLYAVRPPADTEKVGTPKKKMNGKRIQEIYEEMEEPSYDEEFDELYLTYFNEEHFETEPWA